MTTPILVTIPGGRYRHVLVQTWTNPAFCGLSVPCKLVAFYLLTGPLTNSLGLYRLSVAASSEDFAVSPETFRRQFKAVLDAFAWQYDAHARVLWIPEWLQINPPQSPNVVRSWRTAVQELPTCALKTAALSALHAFVASKGEAFQRAFREAFGEDFSKANGKPLESTPDPDPEIGEAFQRKRRADRRLANAANTRAVVDVLRQRQADVALPPDVSSGDGVDPVVTGEDPS